MLRSFLNLGGRLLLICLVAALALSVTYYFTAPVVEANELAASLEARQSIFPDSDSFTDFTSQEVKDICTQIGYSKISSVCQSEQGGTLVSISTNGYNELTLMVGINPDGTCAGYVVLSSTETSGIGSKVTESKFMDQFVGLKTPFTYGNGVDAVSGATLSSTAVREAVNYASAVAQAIGGAK